MKKMKKILFVLVLVPIVLYAASRQTYSDAAGTANNLMNTGYYQNTSNQYILTTIGGDKLIDKDDYEKSILNGRTYLSDGVEYWTKTDCSGGKYVVTASGDLECKSTGANYNTRASYYVKSNVSVTGRGTYDSPWMFEPMYKVTIMETPIDSGSLGVSEKYVPKNGTVTFEDITPAEGNRYIANDCGGTYDSSAKTFTTGKIINDTTCKLTFGTGKFQVTLNKATPRVIYVSYKDDFYSDSERTRPIREVVVEPRDGYTFKGYFYNNGVNNAIIIPVNGQNKIQRSTAGAIDKDVTLNPTYEIDSPEPSDITISGGTNVVYGHKETTLTCTNAKAYDENTDVYYEFGYKENLADATTWLANQSTNNKYYVSKATPRGTRYYTCRVQARDKVDTTIQTPWVASGSTTSMVVSNARIDFDATTNGGTLSGTTPLYAAYNDNQVYTSHMGATPGAIPVATRTGYTMNGWYTAATNGSRVIDGSRNIQASVSNWTNSESKFLLTKYQNTAGTNKLFAQFTANTITVKYNANGGTGTMANKTCTYDQDCILDQNTFTRTGYTFQGWATSAGGSKVYNDKENIKNKSTGGTYNLYAVWKANDYVITFYQGNGTSTAGVTKVGEKTCTYGSNCVLPAYSSFGKNLPYAGTTNPCNNQWEFAGWTTSTSRTTVDYNNSASFTYNTAGNMSLYLLEKREIYFMSGIAPTSFQTQLTQYWNPYSTADTYLTAVRFPNAIAISGWSFYGFMPGLNTVNTSDVKYNSSTQNTDVKVPYNTCRYLRSVYNRTLTVSYNGNGNTGGSVSSQTATQYYNSGGPSGGSNVGAKVSEHSFTLSNNGFTKTGYTFNKWAIGSTSGTKVDPGYSYSFSPAVNATNTSTIYAMWNDTTKPTLTVVAKEYDGTNTGGTLKASQTFTSNGTFEITGWKPTGAMFSVNATDNDAIDKIVWSWNTTGQTTDTGNTYSGGSSTYTVSSKDVSLTAQGWRKGKLEVYDKSGNILTVVVVVKIDTAKPTCTLKVTTSGVQFNTRNDNLSGVASYDLTKSSSATYNNNTSQSLSTGTFYGHVKDNAGNTNSCSVVVANTVASQWTKKSEKCISYTSSVSGNYTQSNTCTTSTCSNSGCSCTPSSVSGSYTYSCSKSCTTSTCNTSGCSCSYSSISGQYSYSCQRNCNTSNCGSWDSCRCLETCTCRCKNASGVDVAGVGDTRAACTSYCKSVGGSLNSFSCRTTGATGTFDSTCYANCSSSTGCKSGCTCTGWHASGSYTGTCSTSCTTSTCNKSGCTCSYTASGTYNTSHACTTSTCSKSGCTCTTSYKFDTATTQTGQTSCSNNNISCGSSTNGQTKITCTATAWSCASGYTKLNDTYCYK